jgi:hypothetical protein
MARIKTYEIDSVISDNDIVIGSDGDSFDRTKNYTVGDLRAYINAGLVPITGGTLKITKIVDNQDVEPHIFLNAQDPAIEVLQYEIVFFILGGKTWIFRRNNGVFGVGETQTVLSDFTFVDVSSSVPTPTLDEVLTAGNDSIQDAEIGALGLWDEDNELYGYLRLKDGVWIFEKSSGTPQVRLTGEAIEFTDTINTHVLKVPFGGNYEAELQEKTGVLAYMDDLPTVPVQTLTAGTNITINDLGDGEFEIVADNQLPVLRHIVNTEIYDQILEVVIVSNGGEFNISANMTVSGKEIRIVFNDDITINPALTSGQNIGFLNLWRYDADDIIQFYADRKPITRAEVSVSGNVLSINNKTSNFIGDPVVKFTISLVPNGVLGSFYDAPEHIKTWYEEIV